MSTDLQERAGATVGELRELDAEVAELMGWTQVVVTPFDNVYGNRSATDRAQVPAYSTSLDACAAVEAEIARRGLTPEYVWALNGLLGVVPDYEWPSADDWWIVVTADAATRCRAAVLACRGDEGS
jgi:hypothetical protein